MVKKAKYSVVSDYVLVILLLFFSGDPVAKFLPLPTVMAVALIILVVKYSRIKHEFFIKFFQIVIGLFILFLSQFFVLHFESWLGAFRYMALFLFGGLIYHLVAERFAYRFFIIMFYVSLISLAGFVVINLLNVHPRGLLWKPGCTSYLVYSFVLEHHFRNSGMFWEPGAFAGILTLCIAFNAKYFPELWKDHKIKIIVLMLALLTTQSTTGYIVFFIIVIYYLAVFIKTFLIKIVIIPAIFLGVFLVFENTPFLQQKIAAQSDKTQTIVSGQFTNTRFGSFILDMHYIKKHPVVGNGLNEITRYADDPLIIQRIAAGDNIANANGFSNFLACLGIPFMIVYFISCFNAIRKVDTTVAFLICFVILLALWGEQWLNYPIFTGIMFINIKKYTGTNKEVRT